MISAWRPLIAEILAHRATGERSDVLHRRRIGSGGRDDDGVIHRAVVRQRLDDLRHGGALLSDRDIDADDVAALLVDDRVERDRGLARLTVADDQFALAAADRDHRVDGLDAGLQRLFHRLPVDDARRQRFKRIECRCIDGTIVVDRVAERIHHAADQRVAHRHGHDAAGAADFVAFLDRGVIAQQHGADLIFFEVQGDA